MFVGGVDTTLPLDSYTPAQAAHPSLGLTSLKVCKNSPLSRPRSYPSPSPVSNSPISPVLGLYDMQPTFYSQQSQSSSGSSNKWTDGNVPPLVGNNSDNSNSENSSLSSPQYQQPPLYFGSNNQGTSSYQSMHMDPRAFDTTGQATYIQSNYQPTLVNPFQTTNPAPISIQDFSTWSKEEIQNFTAAYTGNMKAPPYIHQAMQQETWQTAVIAPSSLQPVAKTELIETSTYQHPLYVSPRHTFTPQHGTSNSTETLAGDDDVNFDGGVDGMVDGERDEDELYPVDMAADDNLSNSKLDKGKGKQRRVSEGETRADKAKSDKNPLLSHKRRATIDGGTPFESPTSSSTDMDDLLEEEIEEFAQVPAKGKPKRTERRRMQNRLAQRAFRARKKIHYQENAVYLRQMEQEVETFKLRFIQQDETNAKLQRENVELRRENVELRQEKAERRGDEATRRASEWEEALENIQASATAGLQAARMDYPRLSQ